MITLRSLTTFAGFAAFTVIPAIGQQPAPAHHPEQYKIVYTGRLFGYFRYPEVQVKDASPTGAECPNDEPGNDRHGSAYAPEAAAFIQYRENVSNSHDPLVAVGDNFAPFLLARRVWGKRLNAPSASLIPKEDFDPGELSYDNVACFMRLAHFAAIVPGKEDFYFGPQRLRDLERMLAAPAKPCNKGGQADPNCYTPVRMLGANISLKVQRTRDTGNAGDRSSQQSAFRLALPKVVLPWMRSFPIVAANPKSNLASEIASARLSNTTVPAHTYTLTLTVNSGDASRGALHLEQGSALAPWAEYHIMITRPNGHTDDVGQFKVAEPFFTQGANPWAMATTASGTSVAIFGVVDQDMDRFVGRMNYTWLGLKQGNNSVIDPSYESIINVTDPAEALNQALQLCSQSDACRAAPKVLLAQMPQAEVHQNLLPFVNVPSGTRPFDIVITQVDPDAATGDRTSTVTGIPNDRHDPLKRPVVLVPGADFPLPAAGQSSPINPYALKLRLQIASVTIGPGRTVQNEVKLDRRPMQSDPFNHCLPPLDALTVGGSCGEGRSVLAAMIGKTSLARNTPFQNGAQPQDWQTALEQISLAVMRNACNADIAMLQHRDVFYDERLVNGDFTTQGVAAALGAIFWKGDFIQCINITGQTISSVLQRSADIERAEDAGEYTDLSRGWPIAFAGIVRVNTPGSDKPQWLVHGEFLDPKRLYSVAITDYLANGDTGYSDLQHAEPDPQTALAHLRLWRLTDHLVAKITGTSDKAQHGADILDKMDQTAKVPPTHNQDTFFHWLRSWRDLDGAKGASTFDMAQQQLPTWFVKLYKADFGYSLFQHNVNEAAIGAEFPGVTAVDLTNVDSETYNADLQLRIQHDWTKWEIYSETDANFGRRNQRSRSAPSFFYQPSQTADVWYWELGSAIRLRPPYPNPSGLKLILPMSVKSQIVPPYTQITPLNAKGSGGSTNPITAPYNFYWAFRPGFRFEHNFPRTEGSSGQGGGAAGSQSAAQTGGSKGQGKGAGSTPSGGGGQSQSNTLNSYIEAGFQAGEVFRSPSAFTFSNPIPGTAICPSTSLVPVENILQCIGVLAANAQLTSVIGDRDFYQQGAYLNFRIDAPLPGRSTGEYIIENRGDIFFNRRQDAPVDVRFLDDMKHSLQLPIYGKFSLGPSIELIFFKAKVSGNYYFSYSTSVSLSYSFDWHPGLSWPKALGFGNSQTAPNPLPTK